MIINVPKKFVVMRGLPGCGKTTEARKIMREAVERDEILSATILSTDDFFLDESGNYHFRNNAIRDYHAMNFDRCVQMFQAAIQLVILDNHNIKRSHYAHYVKAAQLYGYDVEILEVGSLDEASYVEYHRRCIHGAPMPTIARLATEYEEDSSFDRVVQVGDGLKAA